MFLADSVSGTPCVHLQAAAGLQVKQVCAKGLLLLSPRPGLGMALWAGLQPQDLTPLEKAPSLDEEPSSALLRNR